jgi:hypothetical protein
MLRSSRALERYRGSAVRYSERILKALPRHRLDEIEQKASAALTKEQDDEAGIYPLTAPRRRV